MLDAAGPKALGARLLLRSLVTHCSKARGCHGRAIGWLGDSVSAVPDRFGRTAGSRWVRTSAGAVVGWQGASRAAGGLPDPEGGDQAAPFTIAAAVPGGFGVHDRRLHAVRPAVRDDHTAACRPACRLASRYSRAWSLREWIRRFGMGRGKAARPIRRHGAAGCRRRRGCRGRFQAHAVSGGHLRTTPATQADALFWECPAGARWQVVSAGIGLSRDRCPAHRRLPRGGKRPDRSCPRAARRPRGAQVGAAADLASRANTLVGHPWHPSCPLGAGEGPAYQGAEVSRQARCVGHVLSRRGDVPEPHG